MKNTRLIFLTFLTFLLLLPGCSRYTKEDLDKAREYGYEQGHKNGYRSGYSNGYERGNSDGHKMGFEEGKQAGHETGYKKGKSVGYIDGHTDGAAGFIEDSFIPTLGAAVLFAFFIVLFFTFKKYFHKTFGELIDDFVHFLHKLFLFFRIKRKASSLEKQKAKRAELM